MDTPFAILYEDNHLLAIDKPAGMLTQKGATEELSVTEHAKAYVKKRYGKKGEVFLHALHRLDRCTSGIVLFARTSRALGRLNLSWQQHVKKTYWACVSGSVNPQRGVLHHYLIHGSHKAFIGTVGDKAAKLSTLYYGTLASNSKESLLSIDLKTGRYHQIRAQLAAIGHPILGDSKYGSRVPCYYLGAIALHQVRLQLLHPVTEEALCLTAPCPDLWPLFPI